MRSAAHLSIESMCRLGQVSRAGFYRHWREREPRVEETALRARMHQIVLAHRRNYGYRRVTRELQNQGWAVNHKRVARLMREDNLLCLRKRGFVRTTDSGHDLGVWLNLAAWLELSGIDQLWVADITYIRLAEEFVFLAVVLDAFSRRVLAQVAGRAAGCRAGYRRAASGHRPAPTRAGPDASLRPRRAVRLGRLRQPAAGTWHPAQHEPGRKPLRQRKMRELHEDPETGGDLHPQVSRPRRSGGTYRRVLRAVLQSQTAALGARIPLAGAVRAQPAG